MIFRKGPVSLAIAAMVSAWGIAASAAPGDALTPEFTVLNQPTPSQFLSSVARDGRGNFVVVFADTRLGAIFGRRFAADGSPLDGGFQVTPAGATVSSPDVAMDDAGNFVVTWVASSQGIPSRVYARRYAADGTAADPLIFVETANPDVRDGAAAVAMDRDGDFVVVWERAVGTSRNLGPYLSFELGNRQVVARRYSRVGLAQQPVVVADRPTIVLREFVASAITVATGLLSEVDVAMDSAGDFVVAWGGSVGTQVIVDVPGGYGVVRRELFSTRTSTIFARRYSSVGVAQGLPIRVDGDAGRGIDKSRPALAMDADGDFVVAWSETQPETPVSTSRTVNAQRYSAAGAKQGAQIRVETASEHDATPSPVAVSSSAAGSFVLAYQSPNPGGFPTESTISAHRYSAAGVELAPQFYVFPLTTSPAEPRHEAPAIASDPQGNFVVVGSYGRPVFNAPSSIVGRLYEGP